VTRTGREEARNERESVPLETPRVATSGMPALLLAGVRATALLQPTDPAA